MIEVRTYSIDELVDLTGFSQRNIAYYIQQGLLPKIGRRGRNTRYPELFVERLRFIQRVRDLQDTGRLGSFTLPRIARVIWYLVERSGDTGELPQLDDRELQRLLDDESISDERVLGKTDDGGSVTVSFGKFGPYVRATHGTASIDAEEFSSIDLEEALERISEKEAENDRQIIKEFREEGIQVRDGRYGPYVKYGDSNAKIPRDVDPTRVTLEQCKDMIEHQRAKKARKSASKRRDQLASRVHRRVASRVYGSGMIKTARKHSLARSYAKSGDPATRADSPKSLPVRSRRESKSSEDSRSHAEAIATVESHLNVPEALTEDHEISDLLEDSFSSDTRFFLKHEQTDPIAGADFHMAYGLYDQAADLINGELESEPSRPDLLSKLCEIYFRSGNRNGFVDAARLLESVVGDMESADWNKVVIMGQQIAGDEELFAGANVVGAAQAVDLAMESSADEERPSFIDLDSGQVVAKRVACIVRPEDLTSSEEDDIEIYSLQARLLADKIERTVLESNKDRVRQTEYWTRVPVTENIELSVKGIEPEHADLVEAFAEEIRSLLGLAMTKGPSDSDND